MVILLIAYTDPAGLYQHASYQNRQLEPCLDLLSGLLQAGLRLHSVRLVASDQQIELPIQALNTYPLAYLVKTLQNQWQTILA